MVSSLTGWALLSYDILSNNDFKPLWLMLLCKVSWTRDKVLLACLINGVGDHVAVWAIGVSQKLRSIDRVEGSITSNTESIIDYDNDSGKSW